MAARPPSRPRTDRGLSESVQWTLLTATAVLLLLGGVQTAIVLHARAVVANAALAAAEARALRGGTDDHRVGRRAHRGTASGIHSARSPTSCLTVAASVSVTSRRARPHRHRTPPCHQHRHGSEGALRWILSPPGPRTPAPPGARHRARRGRGRDRAARPGRADGGRPVRVRLPALGRPGPRSSRLRVRRPDRRRWRAHPAPPNPPPTRSPPPTSPRWVSPAGRPRWSVTPAPWHGPRDSGRCERHRHLHRVDA